MMKITNRTTKVIGIGGAPLLPDACISISDALAASSMVQHFATIGKVSLEAEGGGEETPAPASSAPLPSGGNGTPEDHSEDGKSPAGKKKPANEDR